MTPPPLIHLPLTGVGLGRGPPGVYGLRFATLTRCRGDRKRNRRIFSQNLGCTFPPGARSMPVTRVILRGGPVMVIALRERRYMPRERVPDRRHTWRQKVIIHDNAGNSQTFYVEFGEYPDGRLAEIFITAHRCGDSFTRGVVDTLARSTSLALQSGTSPHDMAHTLCGQNYPPSGRVEAPSSCVKKCTSIADYIGQEILACYGEDGRRILADYDGGAAVSVPDAPNVSTEPPPALPEKSVGYIGPEPPGNPGGKE